MPRPRASAGLRRGFGETSAGIRRYAPNFGFGGDSAEVTAESLGECAQDLPII